MRIFVTGAFGFLGAHLVRVLRDRGDFVVGLVHDRPCFYCFYPFPDITVRGSFEHVERAIAEYEVDVVFHLAAQTQVSTAVVYPEGTLESNVRGTWQVLEACRRQKVRRVIVASSDKVYGDGPSPYSERQALLPHGVYATSKACADLLAQSYAREFGMSVAVTRCGNLYGPGHTNWSTLIPGTIRSVLRGESPRLRSNGTLKRDYLFVGDAVDGYLRLANSSEVGAFNFGTGYATSVLDVVRMILKANKDAVGGSGLDLDVIVDPQTSAIEIQDQVLDCQRARQYLSWVPEHTLATGLAETLEWYREYLKEECR